MTATLWPLWAFIRGTLLTWVAIPSQEDTVKNRRATGMLVGILIFGAGLCPASAGDSAYGKVTEVKSAEVVTLDLGAAQYDVRIIGIETPKEGPLAGQAAQFVANMVLGKNVRIRFEQRTPNGEMLSKLLTDDPVIGIKDVGLELLRVGLARRQKDFDYKYRDLSRAETEAQQNRRGLWPAAQPR